MRLPIAVSRFGGDAARNELYLFRVTKQERLSPIETASVIFIIKNKVFLLLYIDSG